MKEITIDGVENRLVPKVKSELDVIEKKYKNGDYIGVCKGVDGKWILSNVFVLGFSPSLIHKKHKDILDAYLKDNNVEIEGGYINGDNKLVYQLVELDWILAYNETLEYRLKQQYPIFKMVKDGIFKQISKYDCEWVLNKNSEACGNSFREYIGDDTPETILYGKEKGLYNLQPVWCWDDGHKSKVTMFYDVSLDMTIGFSVNKGNEYRWDNIEPITTEQLKTMPFIFEMYKDILKGK